MELESFNINDMTYVSPSYEKNTNQLENISTTLLNHSVADHANSSIAREIIDRGDLSTFNQSGNVIDSSGQPVSADLGKHQIVKDMDNTPSIQRQGSTIIRDQSDRVISAGLEKTRYVLDKNTDSLSIAAETINQSSIKNVLMKIFNYKYVFLDNIDDGGKTVSVYININSLAKRLQLDKKEIKSAAKEGGLKELIDKNLQGKAEKKSIKSVTIDGDLEVLVNNNLQDGDELKANLFDTFMEKYSKSPDDALTFMKTSAEIVEDSTKEGDKQYELNGVTIFVVKQDSHKTEKKDFMSSHRIYAFSPTSVIGVGGAGKVYDINEIFLTSIHNSVSPGVQKKQRSWVIKLDTTENKDSVLPEKKILDKIHATLTKYKNKHIGIQETIKDNIHIVNKQKIDPVTKKVETVFAANVTIKREGDFQNKIDKTNERYASSQSMLSDIYQLLHGISHLHMYNFLHQDIKPGNILCENKLTFIADMGGAIQAPGELLKLSELNEGLLNPELDEMAQKLSDFEFHTPAYTSCQDFKELGQLSALTKKLLANKTALLSDNPDLVGNYPELKTINAQLANLCEKMIDRRKKWDCFSMGLTLYQGIVKSSLNTKNQSKGANALKKTSSKPGILPPGLKYMNPNFPYVTTDLTYNYKGKQPVSIIKSELIKNHCPEEIADIIANLLNPDSEKRTDTEKSFEILTNYLNKNGSEVIKNVEALYPDEIS